MSSFAQAATFTPTEVLQSTPVQQAPNGLCYASTGQISLSASELERLIAAVPAVIAGALKKQAFYFVPLALVRDDQTLIAERYDIELTEEAVCHRNYSAGGAECVFLSTRLSDDRFSIAFEFFINVAHLFVEATGFSQEFADLVWSQAQAGVKGETSLDAHELRRLAISDSPEAGKAKTEYLQAAFADIIAIYLLSLYMDFDYYELRETDYPLLASPALAERLRKINDLFPAPPSFEFNIYYKRRT
jgi:hypothetical protein